MYSDKFGAFAAVQLKPSMGHGAI